MIFLENHGNNYKRLTRVVKKQLVLNIFFIKELRVILKCILKVKLKRQFSQNSIQLAKNHKTFYISAPVLCWVKTEWTFGYFLFFWQNFHHKLHIFLKCRLWEIFFFILVKRNFNTLDVKSFPLFFNKNWIYLKFFSHLI